MENFPLRFSPVGQLLIENMSDVKSRFLQIGNPSVSRVEVICPKPRRATSVPYVLDSLTRCGPKAKGLHVHGGNYGLEILDAILTEDELEGESDASNKIGFLCGSPPVRTNNPVIQDVEFTKLSVLPPSPLGSFEGMKAARHDKGSPSCGSPLGASPKVRIEGFACGSPDSPRVVSALA